MRFSGPLPALLLLTWPIWAAEPSPPAPLPQAGEGSPDAAREEPSEAPAVPGRDQFLAQLAPIIARSMARTDTGHPVFHGCYDWHSAVHGHWALLRIGRVAGGEQDRARAVEKSLSPDGLAREARYLRQHPDFEMPYGRAWFLRLAIEFELWAKEAGRPDPLRLRAMADEAAGSLLAHYEKHAPDVNDGEYANSSWALVQLYDYAVHSRNGEFRRRTEALIRGRMLEPESPPSLETDAARPEFFSRFGNWAYLVAKTQGASAVAAFLQKHPLPQQAIRPVPLLPGIHHLAMNWSRAWALRALARRAPDAATRARLENAYLEHVRAGMRQHAAHAGDFMAYDHWVPQFAVYALTE